MYTPLSQSELNGLFSFVGDKVEGAVFGSAAALATGNPAVGAGVAKGFADGPGGAAEETDVTWGDVFQTTGQPPQAGSRRRQPTPRYNSTYAQVDPSTWRDVGTPEWVLPVGIGAGFFVLALIMTK